MSWMIAELQRSLRHLYDLAYLETSPLAERLSADISGRSRGTALRQEIVHAIELLRPALGQPGDASGSRAYQIMEGRYIAGLPREQVQQDLALAKSQYYREHARAMTALATILADRWGIDLGGAAASDAEEAQIGDGPESPALQELAEIVRQESPQPVDLATVLENVADLLNQAAPAVRITVRAQDAPIEIRSRPGVLRHALLMLASAAISGAHLGAVEIDCGIAEDAACVSLVGAGLSHSDLFGEPPTVDSDMLRRLILAAGGDVVSSNASLPESPVVRFPLLDAIKERQVLLVDNSRDLADLYVRYLQGEPWTLQYAGSVAEAMEICAQSQPALVLLDVLMPEQDGWQLLAQLRRDATMRQIPVVICSVLHQPELAKSLGATGYIQKPISRQDLLLALERHASR